MIYMCIILLCIAMSFIIVLLINKKRNKDVEPLRKGILKSRKIIYEGIVSAKGKTGTQYLFGYAFLSESALEFYESKRNGIRVNFYTLLENIEGAEKGKNTLSQEVIIKTKDSEYTLRTQNSKLWIEYINNAISDKKKS